MHKYIQCTLAPPKISHGQNDSGIVQRCYTLKGDVWELVVYEVYGTEADCIM